MAAEIFPGPLTVQAADALNDAIDQAENTARDIEKWPLEDLEEFPVKLTAYDSATGACSGTLQTYDANGRRIDAKNNRTFTPTKGPLYPTGGGIMPPASGFPVQVWARRRLLAGSTVAYEFDWVCACATYYGAGASGLGSAGLRGRDLCPAGIAVTGTGTISAPGCPALNGSAITLTYTYLFDWWEGSIVSVGGYQYTLVMIITAAGPTYYFSVAGDFGPSQCLEVAHGVYSCGPPFLASPVFRCSLGDCPGVDLLMNISI